MTEHNEPSKGATPVKRHWDGDRGCFIVYADHYDTMAKLLVRYMNMYPAFRVKPEGAPGSQVRNEQEQKMALEDAARSALKAAMPERAP
jgi:hypothetical protein